MPSRPQPSRTRRPAASAGPAKPARANRDTDPHRREVERLRRRLADAEAQLAAFKRRQSWVESALDAQRHARQVLEAAVSAGYLETIARIREIVCATVPADATILVISRGDEALLNLEGRTGWHFPRTDDGRYAGYHPADSAEAIRHLESLVARGGEYLLVPGTAFWWLEHYRELAEHLQRHHARLWRDERCVIYRLSRRPAGGAAVTPPPPAAAPLPVRRAVFPAPGKRYDVVCFPVIDWDYRFQRPQQLMRQFAVAGHRVFYLSHRFGQDGAAYTALPRAENLWEISLRGPGFKVHQGMLDPESRDALLASLTAVRRDRSIDRAVAIVQSPFWWPLVREAATAFAWSVVYDCLDHQAGFPSSHPLTEEQERELFARSDLVVASSAWLEAQARKHSRQVLLVRNGCDYEHFARVQYTGPGLWPVVGYFGAITEWFDAGLVAELAERRPDWEFILIGSTVHGEVDRLSRLRNVSLPGEKPYAELPGWLAKFDVTILPFKSMPLTEAVNPVKAYEILAAGKPLVSVPLPEMAALAPLVRLASTAPEFEREILEELTRPEPGLETRRRAFARANTWARRFAELAPAIARVLSPGKGRVSRPRRATSGDRPSPSP